jgi:hypothetical protein
MPISFPITVAIRDPLRDVSAKQRETTLAQSLAQDLDSCEPDISVHMYENDRLSSVMARSSDTDLD